MLDFTSALYLGLRHPSTSLAPWAQLTTGAPAALTPPPGESAVARALARLQGCESALLAPSTLHLAWDVFGVLIDGPATVYVDAGTYPILRWGVERAACSGARVHRFASHDAGALRSLLRAQPHGRPIVVTDGLCPTSGRPAPLAAYLECIRPRGGLLLVDDTQGLGILGRAPRRDAPYGTGGGGTLRWSGVSAPNVVVISSLAKAFGVPIAALSGSRAMVARFAARSDTRLHSSPPSAASIHAAAHALMVNDASGDALRLRLAELARLFRGRLRGSGITTVGGLFPVQSITAPAGLAASELHARLLARGIRGVLHANGGQGSPRLSFLLTARHTAEDIEQLTRAIIHLSAPRSVAGEMALSGS